MSLATERHGISALALKPITWVAVACAIQLSSGFSAPNGMINGADINDQGGDYSNALQAVSRRGHDQIVQRLLRKGADVSAQGEGYGQCAVRGFS